MNLLKAVRYARRFKKPGGLYIETDAAGAFITNVPGKGLTHVQFYKTDFEIDTWELEPQKSQLPAEPVSTFDRLDMGLNLIRQAFKELQGDKQPGPIAEMWTCRKCGSHFTIARMSVLERGKTLSEAEFVCDVCSSGKKK